MSRTLKVTIAYDGTDFVGWQAQARGRTVQQEVERSLSSMHHHPVAVVAAGRTDSGVHADGQVVHFCTDIDTLPVDTYCRALNANLPRDIRALDATEVDGRFHARHSATMRTYRYYWRLPGCESVTDRRSVALRRFPSVARLNALARPLLGVHDFSTFTLPSEASRSRVRDVRRLSFFPARGRLVMEIAANAFLWRMVRLIAGTLVELDTAGCEPVEVERRLRARAHRAAGAAAPAAGLVLHRVEYGAHHAPRVADDDTIEEADE